MDIAIAEHSDLPDLARLLWLHAAPAERARQSIESFAVDLAEWWIDHRNSHLAFIARLPEVEGEAVDLAWLAVMPRVPMPGNRSRLRENRVRLLPTTVAETG